MKYSIRNEWKFPGVFLTFFLILRFFRVKTEIIRRHQVVIHPIPVPLQGQTVAGPVEVAVVTGPHPIGSQQVQNGLAAVAGVAGG